VLVKNEVLRVLLVEDNSSDARLLREMFSKEKKGSFELTHVTHMREAEIRLAKGDVDIVYWTWDCRMGAVPTFCAELAQRPPPL
jgi:CheY-like chemotaxis protein